jgi:hypothetical protein
MSVGPMDEASGPIAAILDFAGADATDYRRLSDRLHTGSRRHRLQGCLYHWMRSYPDGFRVIEFWMGREPFERFLDHEFRPLIRELGMIEPVLSIEAVPEDVLFDDKQVDPPDR